MRSEDISDYLSTSLSSVDKDLKFQSLSQSEFDKNLLLRELYLRFSGSSLEKQFSYNKAT
jgi:hypothetical protein